MTYLDPKYVELSQQRGHMNVSQFEPILNSHGRFKVNEGNGDNVIGDRNDSDGADREADLIDRAGYTNTTKNNSYNTKATILKSLTSSNLIFPKPKIKLLTWTNKLRNSKESR